MNSIIQLLPDAVINQIAAGEVVQRPSSAVKEMLDNAIDAGASLVKVMIIDAGKTLIQVIDDGCGMSALDANLCFERHATSKIRQTDDLFKLYTMGFRGEALASIAAIAQVEMRTKRVEDELGTVIKIENSKIQANESVAAPNGTSIAVKNLFYNVPARRNFLKSDAVEFRHILEECQRQALAHPEISFILYHNQEEVFNVKASNLSQRIFQLLGKNYQGNIFPIDENTHYVSIKGYVGKPEFSKKTRGDQYFFVNKRFIKDVYLNHALTSAYEEMLPKGSFPFYTLFLEIDPKHIDVNIHPTKTEIKFDDEKTVYGLLRAVVKSALGQYNIQPELTFENDGTLKEQVYTSSHAKNLEQQLFQKPKTEQKNTYTPYKNPVEKENITHFKQLFQQEKEEDKSEIEEQQFVKKELSTTKNFSEQSVKKQDLNDATHQLTWQLHDKYIFTHIKSGMMMIDQHAAHERVLYEQFLNALENQQGLCQKLLFPLYLSFVPADVLLIQEMYSDIMALGFEVQISSATEVVVQGVPADLPLGREETMLQALIEQFKQYQQDLQLEVRDNLAKSMACRAAIKAGDRLTSVQMRTLIDQLFACQQPYACPHGRPTVVSIALEELDKRFGRIGHLER